MKYYLKYSIDKKLLKYPIGTGVGGVGKINKIYTSYFYGPYFKMKLRKCLLFKIKAARSPQFQRNFLSNPVPCEKECVEDEKI